MAFSILPVFVMLAFVSSSLCADKVLLPRLNNVDPLQGRSMIPGLLKRASSACGTCPSSIFVPIFPFIKCIIVTCCLIAQICCSDGGCCDVGTVCTTVDGVKGCCPIGETCTAPPTTSDHGATTSTITTTKAGTTANSPTSTTTGGGTVTRTLSGSAITSTPTASAGFQVVVIDMSSSALTFSGSWASTNSSCDDGTSKSVSSDTDPSAGVSTVTYHFTGTAIYLKSASSNVHYIVQMDMDITEYGGAASTGQIDAPLNCTYGWWRAGLESTAHTVEITVYGANSTDSSTTQNSEWALELQNFVVIEKTGSGAGNSSGSGSGSGAVTTASVGMLSVWLMIGFWMVLI